MKWPHTLFKTFWASPLGPMTLCASEEGLVGAWFDGQKRAPPSSLVQGWKTTSSHTLLNRACTQLEEYFAGERKTFDLPLQWLHGTPFQRAVWLELLKIAPGTTQSYSRLSAAIGQPRATRAVGLAVGSNPIAIMVPCHRVLGSDGALRGYAAGVDKKRALLRLERAHFPLPSPPKATEA